MIKRCAFSRESVNDLSTSAISSRFLGVGFKILTGLRIKEALKDLLSCQFINDFLSFFPGHIRIDQHSLDTESGESFIASPNGNFTLYLELFNECFDLIAFRSERAIHISRHSDDNYFDLPLCNDFTNT